MTYLGEHYPSLFIHVLRYLDKQERIEQYISQCKGYMNEIEKYSLYLHGYLLIWFEEQRKAGKLIQGKPNHFT